MKSILRDTTEEPVRAGPIEVPPKYAGAVGEPKVRRLFDGKMFESISSLKGTWLGLPVKAIAVRAYLGGDGAGSDILFDAKPEAVLSALSRAGFAPPATGSRLANTDGIGVVMSIVTRPEGVGLRCDYE